MSDAIQCPNSLVAFFPASIYRSAGSSVVLPELLRSVAKEKLSAVQFLPNGAVRLTYKVAADCDAAVSNGIVYGETPLRVVGVEAKSRLVYLRDCPCEVPDSIVENFLSGFGEVHSVSRSEHEGFPGLYDGSRMVKVTLTKDVPSRVRVAGFDYRVWYRRQPTSCPVCRKPGHRGNACPLNGLCRRCAWGPHRAGRDAPSGASVPSSSAASAASRPASAARPAAEAAPPVSHDVEMDFGDEEVVAGAAEAAAAAASSSRPAPRRRRRRSRKGGGAVPFPFPPPGTTGSHRAADLSSLEMDESEDVEADVRFLSTFGEVWRDQLFWGELRSLRHRHVLKKSGGSIRSVVDATNLLFGSASDVGPQPVQGTVPDPFPDGEGLCLWDPSSHRVALHPEDDADVNCIPSEADG